MHYIGVDIAKYDHYAGIRDSIGKPLGKPWGFTNNEAGFRTFTNRLDELSVSADDSIIAMEATGHYWMALYAFLNSKGYQVAVINPTLVSAFRKADTMRKTKTDAIDCMLIAEYARFKRLEPDPFNLEDAEGLRMLTRHRAHLVSERANLKNRTTSVVDRVFPEFPSLFNGNMYSATPRAILKTYATPKAILECSTDDLLDTVLTASKGRLGKDKVREIQECAKRSVGVTFALDSFEFELRNLMETIDYLERQVASMDKGIDTMLQRTPGKWLLTIPGIGSTLAAILTAEIGDPRRFESPKKLIAFAGIDATKAQSGTSCKGTTGKMSKRGSHFLRYALMESANRTRIHEPYFKDYYDSMISRGKHHYVALSGVARKLAAVCLILMKEQRAFEARQSIQSIEKEKERQRQLARAKRRSA